MSVFEAQTESRFLTGSVVIHKHQGSWMIDPGLKSSKSSEWMLAFIVIYAVSELLAGLIAALLPKSLSICVWPGLISRDGFLSQGVHTDFSMHISIIWKNTVSCVHISYSITPGRKIMDY